jgi:hypothetical protein
MSVLAMLRNLWRSIAPRSQAEVEEEFRSSLEAYRDDLMRQGLTAEDAERKARIDLGQPAMQNERYRVAVGLRLFDELGGDIRYGLRALRRRRRSLTRPRHRRHHRDVLAYLRRPAAPLSLR